MPIHRRMTEDELLDAISVTKSTNCRNYKQRYKAIHEGRKVREKNINDLQFADVLHENMEGYK